MGKELAGQERDAEFRSPASIQVSCDTCNVSTGRWRGGPQGLTNRVNQTKTASSRFSESPCSKCKVENDDNTQNKPLLHMCMYRLTHCTHRFVTHTHKTQRKTVQKPKASVISGMGLLSSFREEVQD